MEERSSPALTSKEMPQEREGNPCVAHEFCAPGRYGPTRPWTDHETLKLYF